MTSGISIHDPLFTAALDRHTLGHPKYGDPLLIITVMDEHLEANGSTTLAELEQQLDLEPGTFDQLDEIVMRQRHGRRPENI